MDYIPPKDTDNDDCVHTKEEASKRSLLLAFYFVTFSILLVAGGVFVYKYLQHTDDSQAQVSTVDQSVPQVDDKHIVDKTTNVLAVNTLKPVVVTIRPQDDLRRIFKRFGINGKSATAILALKQAKILKNLRVGKKLSLMLDPTKTKLQKLEYSIDDLDTLVITSTANNNWSVKTKHIEPTTNTRYVTATVNGSVYSTGKKAGISHKLMAKLVDAFSNKVSVNKIRSGDSFSLFYKEYTVDGKKVRESDIVAAELTHKGQTHRIISFTDPHGRAEFYTPDGRTLKPIFIRYPVHFTHIGSRFSLARRHPILGIVRPHPGVDLAAPTGTPIKSAGNGRIAFVGYHGGYGRTIIIKHGIYSTLYAHLSRFSSNVHSGGYVKQGDVIGYVGSSGLSTSPHLHYEFHVNGVHKDPLKVKLPSGQMIASEYRSRFFAQSRKMLAQLDSHRKGHKIVAMYSSESQFE